MDDIYEVVVESVLFGKINEGKCDFYVFVNTKKRQAYKIDNVLTFVNKDTGEKVGVKITQLLYFATVKEMVEMVGKYHLGYTPGKTKDHIEDEYFNNFKIEEVEKFGLVAVNFKKI